MLNFKTTPKPRLNHDETMIEQWNREFVLQRLLALTLLVILIVLCFKVVRFFIVPALWAGIFGICYLSHLYFFHTKVRLSPSFSAFLMTFASRS